MVYLKIPESSVSLNERIVGILVGHRRLQGACLRCDRPCCQDLGTSSTLEEKTGKKQKALSVCQDYPKRNLLYSLSPPSGYFIMLKKG